MKPILFFHLMAILSRLCIDCTPKLSLLHLGRVVSDSLKLTNQWDRLYILCFPVLSDEWKGWRDLSNLSALYRPQYSSNPWPFPVANNRGQFLAICLEGAYDALRIKALFKIILRTSYTDPIHILYIIRSLAMDSIVFCRGQSHFIR